MKSKNPHFIRAGFFISKYLSYFFSLPKKVSLVLADRRNIKRPVFRLFGELVLNRTQTHKLVLTANNSLQNLQHPALKVGYFFSGFLCLSIDVK